MVKNGSYMRFYQKYMCRGCGRSFNDKTGTLFEYSKMRMGEWLYIARELQKNKSINRISKELGRRYKHVMRIAHIVMERVKTRARERRIEIEADEEILHYQEIHIWSENYFHYKMENQAGFSSAQIRQFNETYDVSADNFHVEFDGERKSTILKCDVMVNCREALTLSTGS